MTNNNVQNVKFLRNGNLFDTRELAKNGMLTQLNTLADGTAILGRYKGSEYATDATDVVTLVGFVFNDGTNKSITFFDIEEASAEVEALRQEINAKLGDGISSSNTVTAQLTALSGTSSSSSGDTSVWGAKKYASAYTESIIDGLEGSVTAADGSYVKSVTQVDGKISGTTAALPTVGTISAEGQAITAVSQSNGTVSAAAGDIAAVHVTVADSGELFIATTVEGALAEIAAEINAMDLSVVSGDGEVITAVSEDNGKVSASKTAIKDVKLTGYVKNTSATGDIAPTDDIEDALSKLENKAAAITVTPKDKSIVVEATGSTTEVGVNIRSGERVLKLDTDATSGGVYTALDLVKITEGLPVEIKERYQFKASDGSVIGANIDIPKDSHIVSINYITGGTHAQNLEYVYIDVSGNTQTTYVDMSELVLEAEFESGVTATDGVVHGVVDSTSEKNESEVAFLTVGTNGFKISGIKDAIDTKINKLNAVVTGGTTAGTATSNHVQVIVGEVDGKLTGVTVSETNIANASDLTQEISNRTTADTELSNRLGTGVTTANTATEQLAALVGTAADTKDSSSIVGAKKYTNDKVATIIDRLDADVSGNSTHVTVGVKEENGVITAVTVTEDDIASATALTTEIAARKAVDGQDGQTYAANSGKAYISGATSLNDADIKLNDALALLDADVIKSVKVNNVALAEASNAVNVQISSAAASGTASSPIVVNTDNSTGAVTLQILQIDCGEY